MLSLVGYQFSLKRKMEKMERATKRFCVRRTRINTDLLSSIFSNFLDTVTINDIIDIIESFQEIFQVQIEEYRKKKPSKNESNEEAEGVSAEGLLENNSDNKNPSQTPSPFPDLNLSNSSATFSDNSFEDIQIRMRTNLDNLMSLIPSVASDKGGDRLLTDSAKNVLQECLKDIIKAYNLGLDHLEVVYDKLELLDVSFVECLKVVPKKQKL